MTVTVRAHRSLTLKSLWSWTTKVCHIALADDWIRKIAQYGCPVVPTALGGAFIYANLPNGSSIEILGILLSPVLIYILSSVIFWLLFTPVMVLIRLVVARRYGAPYYPDDPVMLLSAQYYGSRATVIAPTLRRSYQVQIEAGRHAGTSCVVTAVQMKRWREKPAKPINWALKRRCAVYVGAIVTAIAALLLVLAILVHMRGLSQYDAVIRHISESGRPTTLTDYLATVPIVDRALQDDWERWQCKYVHYFYYAVSIKAATWNTWIRERSPHPPDDVQSLLFDNPAVIAEGRALLGRGQLTIGSLGWFAHDLGMPARSGELQTSRHSVSSSLIQHLAWWLRYDALVSSDPRGDLDDLDALQRDLLRPGTASEAVLSLRVMEIRDACYVDLSLTGRLPRDHRDRWMDERLPCLDLLADGFRGERIMEIERAVHSYRELPEIFERDFYEVDELASWTLSRPSGVAAINAWVFGPGFAASLAQVDDQMDIRLRGGSTAKDGDADDLAAALTPEQMLNNFYQVGGALRADTIHRAARISIRVMDSVRDQGAFPPTQGELEQALPVSSDLDAGRAHFRLIYHLSSADDALLSLDLQGPFPDSCQHLLNGCKPSFLWDFVPSSIPISGNLRRQPYTNYLRRLTFPIPRPMTTVDGSR